MNASRLSWTHSLSLLLLTAALVLFPLARSHAGPADDTHDVIYMEDGREFTGQVLSETATHIVFQYVDRKLNMTAKLTLDKEDIFKIERNVKIEDAAAAKKPQPRSKPADEKKSSRTAEGSSTDTSLPAIYVIPMKGQMGTDIHVDVYRKIVDEVRERKPALVIWDMECSDRDDLMISMSDPREQGILNMQNYRNLANLLRDDLRDIPQVMWIGDSLGLSSIVALAWKDVYMKPGARLGGMRNVMTMSGAEGHSDEDVRAKMVAAWLGIANGFLQKGGYPLELGQAMMQPSHSLSATWKGREVEWSLDEVGEYVVDANDEATVNFRAKDAEDLCISKGTAENVEDLVLLCGFREYRVIQGGADKIITDYVEDWRRAYETSKTQWRDVQEKHLPWASGEDTLKYLGRAKTTIQKIISAMERYEAVEIRWRYDPGVSKFQLETQVEQLKEQIASMRRSG